MLGGIEGQEEKGTTEDEMAGWHLLGLPLPSPLPGLSFCLWNTTMKMDSCTSAFWGSFK